MVSGAITFLSILRAPLRQRPQTVQTTLYHLIAAMQDRHGPEDDALIVSAVMELIRAGQLRFLDEMEAPVMARASRLSQRWPSEGP